VPVAHDLPFLGELLLRVFGAAVLFEAAIVLTGDAGEDGPVNELGGLEVDSLELEWLGVRGAVDLGFGGLLVRVLVPGW
jgi:hypothetical protein